VSEIAASAEYPPHDRGAKTVAKPSGTTEQKLRVLFQGLYHNRIIRCPYSSSNTTLVPVAPKVKDKQKMTEDRRQH
jgi:hypothetical protein